jgi:hypothetical protein
VNINSISDPVRSVVPPSQTSVPGGGGYAPYRERTGPPPATVTLQAEPGTSYQTGGRCDRCHGTAFVDIPIHDGESTRRDCARCHRTWGFPKWHGRNQQAQAERLARIMGQTSGKVQPASAMLFDDAAYCEATALAQGSSPP